MHFASILACAALAATLAFGAPINGGEAGSLTERDTALSSGSGSSPVHIEERAFTEKQKKEKQQKERQKKEKAKKEAARKKAEAEKRKKQKQKPKQKPSKVSRVCTTVPMPSAWLVRLLAAVASPQPARTSPQRRAIQARRRGMNSMATTAHADGRVETTTSL